MARQPAARLAQGCRKALSQDLSPGPQTTGANVKLAIFASYYNSGALDVRLNIAAGVHLGMADVPAKTGALTADIALSQKFLQVIRV